MPWLAGLKLIRRPDGGGWPDGRMAARPAVGHFILILIGYEYERTK
jgi:hypothetical protein